MKKTTLTKNLILVMRCCLIAVLAAVSSPSLAGIVLTLDGNDYTDMSSSFIAPSDRTVHVLSVPNQLPLICAPMGPPQGNAETSLILRLDYVNIPLSSNVQISRLNGNTVITATSVDGNLVCNPNTNDAIYGNSFE